MCTFNGQPFVAPQIMSLLNQTRRADQIVIHDDQSTDQTLETLDRFARSHHEIELHQHDLNVGVRGNFQSAIAKCDGDVIFLCDQDDCWEPTKLERMTEVMKAKPEIGFVFSDAIRMGGSGETLRRSLWDSLSVRLGQAELTRFRETGGFECLLKSYFVTGCTMAFQSRFIPLVLPIPANWMHDAWIAICIAAVSSGYPVAEKLVRYRQHDSQQLGERRRSLWQQYKVASKMDLSFFEARLDAFRTLQHRLKAQTAFSTPERNQQLLQAKIEFLESRCAMRRRSFRLGGVAKQFRAGNYRRFAEGWKAAALDLLG